MSLRDRFRLITAPEVAETPTDAAGWAARLTSDQATPQDQAEFERWSLENPEGRADYEQMVDLLGLITVAGADPASRASLRSSRTAQLLGRRSVMAMAVAAAACLFAVVVTPSLINRPLVFETRVGEMRTVLLEDGSTVVMNVGSRLRVQMEEGERRLWLDHGEARFEVAKDARRPFRVFAGDQEVRALGTVFDVRRLDGAVRVVLEEGAVGLYEVDPAEPIRAAATGAPDLVLRPGQQATVARNDLTVATADAEVTGAWRYQRMILDDRPLGEAVAEINRYGPRAIVIDDPEIAAMRISGVFRTDDPDAFVQAVGAVLPVRVAAQDGDVIRLERRG